MKTCPSCSAPMAQHMFEPMLRTGAVLASQVEVDVCWPCHLIWFDGFESTQLSPRAVVEFFKLIHSHQQADAAMLPVTQTPDCPVCGSHLRDSNDFTSKGRFKYWRCPVEHGRLITFVQFLREKSFIRDLTSVEIDTLAMSVKQIRCSSCGGPIDLRKDHACSHCGAAISVLDKDAVTKTLSGLLEAHEARLRDGMSEVSVGGGDAKRGARDFYQLRDTDAKARAIMAAAKFESDQEKERRRRLREGTTVNNGNWTLGNSIDLGSAVGNAGDLLVDSIGEFFSNINF
jgi:Zn-finger nucleic acid-binding protein